MFVENVTLPAAVSFLRYGIADDNRIETIRIWAIFVSWEFAKFQNGHFAVLQIMKQVDRNLRQKRNLFRI